MNVSGFVYESEKNDCFSRVGCYFQSDITCVRRIDLEGDNSHLIILDVKAKINLRIINVYRSLDPSMNITLILIIAKRCRVSPLS